MRISMGAAPDHDHLNHGPRSDVFGGGVSAVASTTVRLASALRVTKRFLETASLVFTFGRPLVTSQPGARVYYTLLLKEVHTESFD